MLHQPDFCFSDLRVERGRRVVEVVGRTEFKGVAFGRCAMQARI